MMAVVPLFDYKYTITHLNNFLSTARRCAGWQGQLEDSGLSFGRELDGLQRVLIGIGKRGRATRCRMAFAVGGLIESMATWLKGRALTMPPRRLLRRITSSNP